MGLDFLIILCLPKSVDNMNVYDRAIGAIFGLAAGDRIGGPTRMAFILGQYLLSQQTFNKHELLEEYLKWWKKRGFDTGPITAKVFSLICSGHQSKEAVKEVHLSSGGRTGGCNPMHRSMVIAAASSVPLEKIEKISRDEASITHYDDLAGKMAALSNLFCRYLILGENLDSAITKVIGAKKKTFLVSARQELERNGYALNVFKAALFFLHNYSSFEESLNASIRFAGLPNYAPVIVGGWAGALYGFSKIPKQYYSHCKMITELASIAQQLAAELKMEK